jgi:hypothetical protein
MLVSLVPGEKVMNISKSVSLQNSSQLKQQQETKQNKTQDAPVDQSWRWAGIFHAIIWEITLA